MSKSKYATQFAHGDEPVAIAEAVVISSTDHTPSFPVRGICMDAVGALVVVLPGGPTTGTTFLSGQLAAGVMHKIEILKVVKSGTGSQGMTLVG